MKYYQLIYNSLNEEVTGTQFQSITGDLGDIQNENIPFEGKINKKFELPLPTLESNAKLTSLINVMFIPNWFLVLENSFISFLQKFDIYESQVWNINITKKKEVFTNYSLFYIPITYQKELINYKDSIFFSCDFFNHNNNIQIEKINDYYDYLKIRDRNENENRILKFDSLVLDLKKIDKDFIRFINSPLVGNFVSEKLKNEILKNNYSGMDFLEIEQINNKIKVNY